MRLVRVVHDADGIIDLTPAEFDRVAREWLREKIGDGLQLVASYLSEPCRFDHHGFCQSHALTEATADGLCDIGRVVAFGNALDGGQE